jgi:hypothetical protein
MPIWKNIETAQAAYDSLMDAFNEVRAKYWFLDARVHELEQIKDDLYLENEIHLGVQDAIVEFFASLRSLGFSLPIGGCEDD